MGFGLWILNQQSAFSNLQFNYPLGPGDTPVGKKEKYFDICEELYVVQGQSLAEIARTDTDYPSDRTLSDWSAAGEWDKKRKEFLLSNKTLKEKINDLKHALVDKAIETQDPQTVYAFAWLLRADKTGDAPANKEPEQLDPKLSKEELVKKIMEVLT